MQELMHYIAKTSPIAKIVLGSLTVLSVLSWAVIIEKTTLLLRIGKQSKRFLHYFTQTASPKQIFELCPSFPLSPFATLFHKSFYDIVRDTMPSSSRETSGSPSGSIDRAAIRELLSKISLEELSKIDKHQIFLATTVSVSPFLGLFGTVWGIMYAFIGMGMRGSADIMTVGPGIAEALITTVFGLAVAIPALFAHNIFSGTLRRLDRDLDFFAFDLLKKHSESK